jgi:hypothetical protein
MVIHDKHGRVIHTTHNQRPGRFGMLASAALRRFALIKREQ